MEGLWHTSDKPSNGRNIIIKCVNGSTGEEFCCVGYYSGYEYCDKDNRITHYDHVIAWKEIEKGYETDN